MYERVIERRLREQVEEKIGNWQHGFRPGRSTTDLVFAMKMLFEKGWEWGKDKCVAFIDMEKAFDRVNREKLWGVMREAYYGVQPKLIRVVQSMYKKCKNKVKSGQVNSGWFEVRTGVRQGGVLSPLLFIIYMDKCLREICQESEATETFAYADDVAVITETAEQLQTEMENWERGLVRNGMKMNRQKTEVMYVGRRREEMNIEIGQETLKQVEDFSYLGVNFNEQNMQEMEINKRIVKYNVNVGLLYPLLRDKNVPRKCKVTIYNVILKPILTYGAECWALTTKTQSKIQAAEMRVLRIIRGVTRRDRLRNERIREEVGTEPLLEEVERAKLRWFGHVKRMPEERMPRKYLEWKPHGKRPVGRPRKRWMEGVEDGLRRRGVGLAEVERDGLCEDRTRWREVVNCRPADR